MSQFKKKTINRYRTEGKEGEKSDGGGMEGGKNRKRLKKERKGRLLQHGIEAQVWG